MRRVRLGDVCRIVSGSTPKSGNPDFWGGAIPWVTPAELDDESHWVFRTDRYLTETGFDSASLRMMPIGTVLLSTRAPIGKTAIAGVEMCCNQGFKNLVCGDEIDCEYLYRFLKSNTSTLQALGRGATFKELSKREVERFEIPLPPLERQHECTSRLDAIDNEIARARTLSMTLDELVKSRFVEMFGDVRTNEFNWPVRTFEELADVITDGEHATPKRQKKGVYLLSARNVKDHMLDLSDVDYIGEDEYQRIARRIVPQESDVLISCSGTIGKCCVVPAGLRFQMVRSAALIRFSSAINPVYAEWLITSNDLQEQIRKSATQSSQANLFQGRIKKLCGIVPPLTLQQEFAAFVAQVDKLKADTQLAIDKLQMLYDSLAQEYFSIE